MTNLTNLKEEAKKDMVNNDGEIGFAEGIIEGRLILIVAKKWGANKPGRKMVNVRYTESDITNHAA